MIPIFVGEKIRFQFDIRMFSLLILYIYTSQSFGVLPPPPQNGRTFPNLIFINANESDFIIGVFFVRPTASGEQSN